MLYLHFLKAITGETETNSLSLLARLLQISIITLKKSYKHSVYRQKCDVCNAWGTVCPSVMVHICHVLFSLLTVVLFFSSMPIDYLLARTAGQNVN